jgi:hypothetical protein
MSPTEQDLDRRVRKVETDFAGHDARSAVFWETQQATNTATLEVHQALHTRISKEAERQDVTEKKFSWIWGVAAGATGLLATAATAYRFL